MLGQHEWAAVHVPWGNGNNNTITLWSSGKDKEALSLKRELIFKIARAENTWFLWQFLGVKENMKRLAVIQHKRLYKLSIYIG